VLSTFAMMLAGTEIVTFTDVDVTRRAEVLGKGLTWRYPMADVTNVRTTADTNGVKDFISLDCQGKTVRFGTGLNETEAERATEAIWKRFPQLMPRVERIRRAEGVGGAGGAGTGGSEGDEAGAQSAAPKQQEIPPSPIPPPKPPTGIDWM
jgi:hypothetical protein